MNQALQQVIESTVLQAVKQVEDQVDAELAKLERPMVEDDVEALRQRRINELKRLQQKKQEWAQRGHGEYTEVEEKEFFKSVKGEERAVCHFYRSNTACQAMHEHLAVLATKHMETKFMKIQAEKAPFLTERLKVWMLPTLAVMKHEKVTDYIVGLDELGGNTGFSTEVLEMRLAAVGAVFEDALSRGPKLQDGVQRTMRKGCLNRTESDEDSDFD